MSTVTTLEPTVIEGEVKVCTETREINNVLAKTTPDGKLRDGPLASLPTGAGEGKGVVTNQNTTSGADVAGGRALDTHPFWLLLKQAGYTD